MNIKDLTPEQALAHLLAIGEVLDNRVKTPFPSIPSGASYVDLTQFQSRCVDEGIRDKSSKHYFERSK